MLSIVVSDTLVDVLRADQQDYQSLERRQRLGRLHSEWMERADAPATGARGDIAAQIK